MRLRWERAPVPFQVVYSPPPLLFSFFSASWGTTRHHFLRAHAHKSKYPPSPPLYHTFWLALLSLPRNDIYARAPALPPPAATPMTGNAAAADISPGAVGWVPWKQRAP